MARSFRAIERLGVLNCAQMKEMFVVETVPKITVKPKLCRCWAEGLRELLRCTNSVLATADGPALGTCSFMQLSPYRVDADWPRC